MKLSNGSIAAVSIPANKKEIIVFDDALPGFGLRVRSGGKRTWIVQYRLGRKQRRLTIGTTETLNPDQARAIAKTKLAMAQLGEDPQVAKSKARTAAALTFAKLVSRYLKDYASSRLKPGTLGDVRRYLERDLKRLAELPVTSISRVDVADAVANVRDKCGPYSANRARAALSSLFAWGMAEGLADTNPVVGTRKAVDEKPRDRVLSDGELAIIWQNAGSDDYGTILKLLILTGQRRDEVGAMRWSELDLANSLWRIPSERTKNSRVHEVPLTNEAMMMLKARKRTAGRDYVFGSKGPFSGWSKAKKSLDLRVRKQTLATDAHSSTSSAENSPVAAWRLHDIRRTVVTGMAELGALPHVIEAVVNHVSGHKSGVAGVYNRAAYGTEKAAALKLWNDHLADLIVG